MNEEDRVRTQKEAIEEGVVSGFSPLETEKSGERSPETLSKGVEALVSGFIQEESGGNLAQDLATLVKHRRNEQNNPQEKFLAMKRFEKFLGKVLGDETTAQKLVAEHLS